MKNLKNLGTTLNKEEQKKVSGGFNITPECGFIGMGIPPKQCPPGAICVGGRCRHVVL